MIWGAVIWDASRYDLLDITIDHRSAATAYALASAWERVG